MDSLASRFLLWPAPGVDSIIGTTGGREQIASAFLAMCGSAPKFDPFRIPTVTLAA
jgi:hypothetical protein